MKKIILVFIFLLFQFSLAQPLKGGVSEDYIPKGFFGSWGVISKLKSSNNPDVFNFESRDIWTLSGYNNILILENLESGARSEIEIKDKQKNNSLKFERQKTVKNKGLKVVYKETVTFELKNDNFTGTDNFIVERYDINNKLQKKDIASYSIAGVKIYGKAP